MSRENNLRDISFPMGHVRPFKPDVKKEKNLESMTRRLESALNAFKDLAFGHPKTQAEIKGIVEIQIGMISKELLK